MYYDFKDGGRQEIIVNAEVVAPRSYQVDVKTLNAITKTPISTSIFVSDVDVPEPLEQTNSNENGLFNFSVDADRVYTIQATKEAYETENYTLDLRNIHPENEKIKIELLLMPLFDELTEEIEEGALEELDEIIEEEVVDDQSELPIIPKKPEINPNATVKILGKVYDKAIGKELFNSTISVVDFVTQKEIKNIDFQIGTDFYMLFLPPGKKYKLIAKHKGYFPASSIVELINVSENEEIRQDFVLFKIEEGELVNMENVLFERSEATLLESSYEELELLLLYLKDNAKLHVELLGHTDNVGDGNLNYQLSQERVKTIKNYLINQGIEADRISGKGYGGSKPIASNRIEKTRRLNRRVEFIITSF